MRIILDKVSNGVIVRTEYDHPEDEDVTCVFIIDDDEDYRYTNHCPNSGMIELLRYIEESLGRCSGRYDAHRVSIGCVPGDKYEPNKPYKECINHPYIPDMSDLGDSIPTESRYYTIDPTKSKN